MSDDAVHQGYYDPYDDIDEGKLVHWYQARPLTLGAAQVSGAVVGAMALGALAAVGILALTGRLRD